MLAGSTLVSTVGDAYCDIEAKLWLCLKRGLLSLVPKALVHVSLVDAMEYRLDDRPLGNY